MQEYSWQNQKCAWKRESTGCPNGCVPQRSLGLLIRNSAPLSILSDCSNDPQDIDKPDRCRHTALTFLPHPALRSIGIPTIFKNTGTCAFQLDLRTLRPSTPPHSCQLRGPHAAGSTLSLGQHPVPGGWSGFCHSEMIWTIPEAMQVGIGFLAPPPCLQNKNLLWGHQTLVADPMVTPLRSWRVTHTSECFSHKKEKKSCVPFTLCSLLQPFVFICRGQHREPIRSRQGQQGTAGRTDGEDPSLQPSYRGK